MAGLTRRTNQNSYIWPGFVDALATILMVVMFLLLIFVLAQFFMSEALTGRDQALVKLKSQITELSELLSLERAENKNIRGNLTLLSEEILVSLDLQENLKITVSDLRKRSEIANQTINILQSQANALRGKNAALLSETQILKAKNITSKSETKSLKEEKNKLKEDLNSANTLIGEQLKKVTALINDIAALNALKANLETEISQLAKDLNKKNETIISNKNKLNDANIAYLKEKDLAKSSRAKLALLTQQMTALRNQLAKIENALRISEKDSLDKKVLISALGKRLNIALASKVQELSKYRSEFFGRLRDLLGNHQGVRIVGDRFVFQSEVLFEKAKSEIGYSGSLQLRKLAESLLKISIQIPKEIDWILRIDGHTDSDPINNLTHPSNWELSADRAISVLKYLVKAGLPSNRLVAAGFGQHHPLDNRTDEIAKRRNRRIELKLTQR